MDQEYRLTSPPMTLPQVSRYVDGSTIDFIREEALERERNNVLRAQIGVRGLLLPWFDAARMWLIVILTGIGVGLTGGWLDVLVKWLGDLREGRCSNGLFYNQVTCCSSVKPGELCGEWMTWSAFLDLRNVFAQSLLHSSVYVALAVSFAGAAAILVTTYAPYAFHTGIPEIKAILGGYVLTAFLTPWTLLIKALGLALAVASGLSLGKEGPLVHVACCFCYMLLNLLHFRNSEVQKRKLLAAAAAAGVSVAFGSPLGGVLFGLEELDVFANESEVMWRGFVASAIAAVALQWVDPFGTSKLVLFQVTNGSDTWRAFELIPWLTLGVIGGVLGSILIRINVKVALYRRRSVLNDWPVLEVIGVSAITAATSYLIVFSRVQASELVANLFQECDPTKIDYHGLCNPTAMWENVFLLLLTAALKVLLTAWTFGMMIPSGIFLPTIAIGACLGRAMGLLVQAIHRAYPMAWIFQSCPPELTKRCISPGFYSVIGASAMLGGVTRMTISLVVILFELTGALSHVLPIMVSVMTAKWIGDALGKDGGIYAAWIAMKAYPWLPPVNYQDKKPDLGAQLMRRLNRLILIHDRGETIEKLAALLDKYDYHSFPVVREQEFLGLITRDKLRSALVDDSSNRTRECVFSISDIPGPNAFLDLSGLLEEAVLQLRPEVPKEFVVNMFQKFNLRQIVFTSRGRLIGMTTRRDVVTLLTCQFAHSGALAQERRSWD
ncbi:Chloride channel protein [Mycena indigotica]|uniref:Chloride channel protein n=1 Tax=Mycena indigotica TaxID=2126181 RepID=A0A8H6T3H9_9AGAR|nr:Chloride channel protein [Mycena indigotica]KAF7309581.1 Chloride channel protein [Mycena indigotica]